MIKNLKNRIMMKYDEDKDQLEEEQNQEEETGKIDQVTTNQVF